MGGTNISGDEAIRTGIYNVNEMDLVGGWLYDEENGRIYARLEDNAYGEGNTWIDLDELSGVATKPLSSELANSGVKPHKPRPHKRPEALPVEAGEKAHMISALSKVV